MAASEDSEKLHNDRKCIGLIEVRGLAAAIEAADTAVKSGNVELIGYEYSGFHGMIVVKVEGNVGAVKAAIQAASTCVDRVHSSIATLNGLLQKSAIDGTVYDMLIHNKYTVGDPKQIESGYRPQGTTRQPKWVGHWDQSSYIIE